MKEILNCPVCKSTKHNILYKCKDYTVSKASFNVVTCSDCNFSFTNPIPQESEIGKYYESEDYISHSNTSKGLVNSLYQSVRNYTLTKKIKLLKSLSDKKSILDIGCGTGEFLYQAQQNGFSTQGIEPSETARKQAIENYHLEVNEESKLNEFENSSFDFISMWHVLEHVYHLEERITQITRLLKTDGHLIIAVPNLSSYDANHYKEHWAAFDVPRHLYHFAPKTIELLFRNNGFELHKILPMKFDSFYVSMLSEKYKTRNTNLIKAFFIGLISNLKAKKEKTYSSQIYIFKKLKKD